MIEIQGEPQETGFLEIDDSKLEYAVYGSSQREVPAFVFLHEGLGCVRIWKDFPLKLCLLTGFSSFLYSRAGYGQSSKTALPRPLDYMTREALDVLPKVLDQAGIQICVLVGHSDGATIAALFSAACQDSRVRGIVLIAPHFFSEPKGLSAIAQAKQAYETGNLRQKLLPYHKDVDNAFNGWNNAWLDPEFQLWDVSQCVDDIHVPVLAIQGKQDEYGTLRQIETLQNNLKTELYIRIINNCGHSPHLQYPSECVEEINEFIQCL